MKQLFNIQSDVTFYLLLGFLFLINFSIAGCYILFTVLLLQWIGYTILNGFYIPALPRYYKFLLLYAVVTLISSLTAVDRWVSIKDNKEAFLYLLIPLFLVIITSKKRLIISLYTVLISGVLSAAIGIVDAFRRGGVSLDFRLKGFLSHWMTFSGLLMLTFIFFFVYVFYEKRFKMRIAISIGLILILITIYLSLTRSIWIGIAFALGTFIIYFKPKILYIAIPFIILAFIFLPPTVKNRFISIVDINDASNKDRIFMARMAVNIVKDYPVTGVGPNNIPMVYDRYKPPEAQQTNLHLHNNFFQVAAERGILGLLSLLIAFVSIIINLVRKIKIMPHAEKVIPLGVLFVFIGFLVAGLFEYNYGDTEIKFLLFFFISIPFITLKESLFEISDNKINRVNSNGTPI